MASRNFDIDQQAAERLIRDIRALDEYDHVLLLSVIAALSLKQPLETIVAFTEQCDPWLNEHQDMTVDTVMFHHHELVMRALGSELPRDERIFCILAFGYGIAKAFGIRHVAVDEVKRVLHRILNETYGWQLDIEDRVVFFAAGDDPISFGMRVSSPSSNPFDPSPTTVTTTRRISLREHSDRLRGDFDRVLNLKLSMERLNVQVFRIFDSIAATKDKQRAEMDTLTGDEAWFKADEHEAELNRMRSIRRELRQRSFDTKAELRRALTAGVANDSINQRLAQELLDIINKDEVLAVEADSDWEDGAFLSEYGDNFEAKYGQGVKYHCDFYNITFGNNRGSSQADPSASSDDLQAQKAEAAALMDALTDQDLLTLQTELQHRNLLPNPEPSTIIMEVRNPSTEQVFNVEVLVSDSIATAKHKFRATFEDIECQKNIDNIDFFFAGKPVEEWVAIGTYASLMSQGRNLRFDAVVRLKGGGKRGRVKQDDEDGMGVEALVGEMKRELEYALTTVNVQNQSDPTFVEAATAIRQVITTLDNDGDNVEFLRMLNRLPLEKLRHLNLLTTKNYDHLWQHLGIAYFNNTYQKVSSKKTDAMKLLNGFTAVMKLGYTKQFYSGKNYDNDNFKRIIAAALERASKDAGRHEASANGGGGGGGGEGGVAAMQV
jgi:hypothetical protein